MKGGILMYPILFCSVSAIAIIIERLYHFNRAGIDIAKFRIRIKGLLEDGNISEARRVADSYPGPIAKVTLLALKDNYRDSMDKEEVITRIGSQEIRRLEGNLRGLSIIGNIAPLLGLLGTVTGMIQAFTKIAELGGRVDVTILAGGIWEAMITTAAGLFVAIPAMVAYYLFEGKVDHIANSMKDMVSEIGGLVGVKKIEGFIEESRMEAIKEEVKEEVYGI
jgi:biopolymer transport protein ExbB